MTLKKIPNLFDALKSIGASMNPIWHGEWTGPIMFDDQNSCSRVILVELVDHDLFDVWQQANPNYSDEELQIHGREALARMCGRPINMGDYA